MTDEQQEPSQVTTSPALRIADAGLAFLRTAPNTLDAAQSKTMTEAAQTVKPFLDLIGFAKGRATYYTDKAAQAGVEAALHKRLFSLDRGLYAMLCTLPGVTDRSRQAAIKTLLSRPLGRGQGLLSEGEEGHLVEALLKSMPITRQLKFFRLLKAERLNNSRTRKLILKTILRSPRLELWSTRYRKLLRSALSHALGQRMTSVLRSILAKDEAQRSLREQRILRQKLGRWVRAPQQALVFDCVGFVLGLEAGRQRPLLKAYVAAKTRLEDGRTLSTETLEGLRSCYHKDRSFKEVLELTKSQLTKGQSLKLQATARAQEVSIDFVASAHSAVELYVYAFKQGMTEAISEALDAKAKKAAEALSLQSQHVGVLLDASSSMAGSREQKLRPMARALANRDVLAAASERCTIVTCGGQASGRLHTPGGPTALSLGLVELLGAKPERVFVLSDGYENAPSGRFMQTVAALRRLGLNTPIVQLSPVFAADTQSVRALAPELVPALPLPQPKALALTMVRAQLDSEPAEGLKSLCQSLFQGLLTRTIAGTKRRALARPLEDLGQ